MQLRRSNNEKCISKLWNNHEIKHVEIPTEAVEYDNKPCLCQPLPQFIENVNIMADMG